MHGTDLAAIITLILFLASTSGSGCATGSVSQRQPGGLDCCLQVVSGWVCPLWGTAPVGCDNNVLLHSSIFSAAPNPSPNPQLLFSIFTLSLCVNGDPENASSW